MRIRYRQPWESILLPPGATDRMEVKYRVYYPYLPRQRWDSSLSKKPFVEKTILDSPECLRLWDGWFRR